MAWRQNRPRPPGPPRRQGFNFPAIKEEEEELLRDLPAQGGWIWSKPDLIDDDEKVAKRVAWLNKYGCLAKQIEWAEVADLLDSLKVAHAMVLLRDLEMQGNKVRDPTDFIKRAVEQAGGDEIDFPVDSGQSAVADRIEELNSAGTLSAEIDSSVLDGLEGLPEDDALGLLQEVADKGQSVKNPTSYIRFKLKARLAVLGVSPDAPIDEHSKILKRVEWLNDYGGLLEDIQHNKVAGPLESVGLDAAMTILKELEDQSQGIAQPTDFILRSVRQTKSRASSAAAPRAPRTVSRAAPSTEVSVQEAAEPVTPLQALNDFMAFLNTGPGKRQKVKLAEVAGALEALGTKRAMRILKEMQEKGLGLDDPVSYIKAAAQRHGFTAVKAETLEPETAEGVDDVSRLTSRCKWLNQFAGLAQKIVIDEVIGALYCLGVPQSMSILRGLQERGASVPDPTRYIKQAVQHANTALAGEDSANEAKEEDDEGDELDDPWAEAEDEAFEWPDESDQANWWDDEDLGEEFAVAVGEDDENDEGWLDWAAAAEPAPKKPRRAAADAAAAAAAAAAAGRRAAARLVEKRDGPRRVVGALTGYKQLVPSRATAKRSYEGVIKQEIQEKHEQDDEDVAQPADIAASPSKASLLPLTPQEKMAQVRCYASKHSLCLDDHCIKSLSRLPFYRAKDLIEEVLLGGRQRRGVSNPSGYLTRKVQQMSVGLGVEQGIAMELAVSLGVVLNNDALDELASIPRQESHAIIRELAQNETHRADPMAYIQAEVLKCREQLDAGPADEDG
ncbi:unnamed protein product [Symbiodinium natans]|uniref:Uncharacterized protein n=1 Tax=Symbiodinium natans TaxID=878477 RepID=A0A812T939_9DINO|nr:unnamed protein product [Symbiodinium natans]